METASEGRSESGEGKIEKKEKACVAIHCDCHRRFGHVVFYYGKLHRRFSVVSGDGVHVGILHEAGEPAEAGNSFVYHFHGADVAVFEGFEAKLL